MDLDLDGRHALVCGASEGIGRATAEELAALGASVTVLSRREGALRDVVAGLAGGDSRGHAVAVADSADTDGLRAAVDAVVARRPVHILVNNTGGPPGGPAANAPLAVQAMEAGYNVLVEKPVTATVQDLAWMQEAERRTGRWCAVDYQFVYSPTTQWVLDKLTGGELGRLLEARVRISWPRSASYYARNAWAGQLRRADGAWVLDGPATNATAHYLLQALYWAAVTSCSSMAKASTVTSCSGSSRKVPRVNPIMKVPPSMWTSGVGWNRGSVSSTVGSGCAVGSAGAGAGARLAEPHEVARTPSNVTAASPREVWTFDGVSTE